MKAVVYHGPRQIGFETVRDPQIESPLDAIVRITTANICGSDLHPYEGRADMDDGMVIGHENMGIVEDVDAAVGRIKVGENPSLQLRQVPHARLKNAYENFDKRLDGWTKVLLHPGAAR
jgi:glutathione-independent formaldehyde dehydrogenase